jgi:hypothetical protein
LTGEESHTVPVAGDGFEQCYHAQAVLAADSLLVVATMWCGAPTTSSSFPHAEQAHRLPSSGRLDAGETLLADNGSFSAARVTMCRTTRIALLIAMGRPTHHPSPAERFAEAPPQPEDPAPGSGCSSVAPPEEQIFLYFG